MLENVGRGSAYFYVIWRNMVEKNTNFLNLPKI